MKSTKRMTNESANQFRQNTLSIPSYIENSKSIIEKLKSLQNNDKQERLIEKVEEKLKEKIEEWENLKGTVKSISKSDQYLKALRQ